VDNPYLIWFAARSQQLLCRSDFESSSRFELAGGHECVLRHARGPLIGLWWLKIADNRKHQGLLRYGRTPSRYVCVKFSPAFLHISYD